MRKCKKCRKKTIINNYYNVVQKKQIEPVCVTPQKLGFWKSVALIISNREPKTGQTTAFLLSNILSYIFNALALIGVAVFVIWTGVTFTKLDWTGTLQKKILQGIIVAFLLLSVATISLIFRAVANDVKAEKDRNYITNLFFGFTGLASLVIALLTFFKEVG